MGKNLSKKSAKNKSITKKVSKNERRAGLEKYDFSITLVQKGCK